MKKIIYIVTLSLFAYAIDLSMLSGVSPADIEKYKSMLESSGGGLGLGGIDTQKEQTVTNNIPQDDTLINNITKNDLIIMKKLKDEEAKQEKQKTPITPFTVVEDKILFEKYANQKAINSTENTPVRYSKRFFENQNEVSPYSIPTPDNYEIAIGDEISIYVYGASNQNINAKVDSNGKIKIPKSGSFRVAGLTFKELKKVVDTMIEKAYSYSQAIVDISTYSTIQVNVVGEVAYPGIYNLLSFSTVKDALVASKGVNDSGSVRAIKLMRDGKLLEVVDLYDFLITGSAENKNILKNGDVIVVPEAKKLVTLIGINKDAYIYELNEKETINTLLKFSAGIRNSINLDNIRVKRYIDNKKIQVLTLNRDILKSFDLADGDSVEFYPISTNAYEYITLNGNIATVGEREIPQDKLLNTILHNEVGSVGKNNFFLENTFFNMATIKSWDKSGQSIRSFNVDDILDDKVKVELKPKDEIYFFNKIELKENEYIHVTGKMVDEDKNYQYYEGMSVGDLYNIVKFRTFMYIDEEEKEFKIEKPFEEEIDKTQKTPIETEQVNLQTSDKQKQLMRTNINGDIAENVANENNQDKKDSHKDCKRVMLTVDKRHVLITRYNENEKIQYIVDVEKNSEFKLNGYDSVEFFDYYDNNSEFTVNISGEVYRPDLYNYTSGETLYDLISFAGGFTHKALKDRVEVVRFFVEDNERKSRVVEVEYDDIKDFVLQPDDNVLIRRISKWNEKKYITLDGEVKFPGIYVVNDGDKLYDILQRAGGFTSEAFIGGAVFTRASVQKLQKEEYDKSLDELEMQAVQLASSPTQAGENAGDKARMLSSIQALVQKSKAIEPIGRVTIQLDTDLEKFKESNFNIILENEDKLVIPKERSTITVIGEVLNANTFIYKEGADVEYFINNAGGLKTFADDNNIYIVKADGNAKKYDSGLFWGMLFAKNTDVAKGDTIIVPRRIDTTSGIALTKDIVDIIYKLSITTASLTAAGVLTLGN